MKRRLLIELSHFQKLPAAAGSMLVSAGIYEFAYPLLFVFLSAFLFRSTGSFTAAILYHSGMYIALPLTFYLNGLLLKRWRMPWLLSFGLVFQGVVSSLVFFMSSISFTTIFIMGLLQGVAMGFYWANRNFMNLTVIQDEQRDYFTGLETIVANVAGIIAPFFTGWILILGAGYSRLSIQQMYQLLALVAMLAMTLAGMVMFSAKVANPQFKKLWLGAISSPWNKGRIREVIYGISHGLIIFVPPTLTLFAIGQEEVLGTLQSIAAIFGSLFTYVIARKVKAHKRRSLLFYSIILNLLITIPLSVWFEQWAILIYLLGYGFTIHLMWLALSPVQMKIIDEEEGGDSTNNYAYVADRELFLNIGRIMGMAVFLPLVLFVSQEVALRISLLLVAILQFGLILTL